MKRAENLSRLENINKINISNINYLKEKYNPNHAQDYAKNYNSVLTKRILF